MANLDFLDAKHEVFTKNEAAWKRDERRLYGGDTVLSELAQWRNESTEKYQQRQAEASWVGFGKTHATILAGHIISELPLPDYGSLGSVRARDQRKTGQPSVGELLHYNVDGIGADGMQLHAWVFGILQRAMATGHRWTLVEMPRRAGRTDASPVTQAEVLAGHRPYGVEYSPRSVPYWEYDAGRLDWAVIRTRVGRSGMVGGRWEPAPTANGYYLHVRENYAGLGDEFAEGGWWLFDSDKRLIENGHGRWLKTNGQIPLFRLTAESSAGTIEWPAISRSLTMPLDQMSVSLMNRISERNFDASDAAKSIKFILGAIKEGFNLTVEFLEDGAVLVPVIGFETADGKQNVPSIYDSSSGAVAAEVFTTIIQGTIAEAHEIMVRQLTSTPDSSGRSKEVGFGEATSPLLSSLASNTETWLNTFIHFAELRAGTETPTGFVQLPREFELAPVIEKIDRVIDRAMKIGASSPTLFTSLIRSAATENGQWPKEEAASKKAEAEITASLALERRAKQAEVFDTFAKSGARTGAAKLAGLTGSEVRALDDVEVEGGNGTDPTQNGNGQPSPNGSRVTVVGE